MHVWPLKKNGSHNQSDHCFLFFEIFWSLKELTEFKHEPRTNLDFICNCYFGNVSLNEKQLRRKIYWIPFFILCRILIILKWPTRSPHLDVKRSCCFLFPRIKKDQIGDRNQSGLKLLLVFCMFKQSNNQKLTPRPAWTWTTHVWLSFDESNKIKTRLHSLSGASLF